MANIKADLFDWLVDYHTNINFKKCEPYIKDNKIYVRNKPLEEGFDENELYKGVLIIANGSTLIDKLKDSKVVLDDDIGEIANINNKDDFFEYLNKQKNNDGAYIVDSINNKMIKVAHLNNNPPNAKDIKVLNYLPENFVSYKGNVSNKEIGTKTRLAIMIPHFYPNTETFQIKRTAYTDLGMGKVTHFTKDGLVEEFYFVPTKEGIVSKYLKYFGFAKENKRVFEIIGDSPKALCTSHY